MCACVCVILAGLSPHRRSFPVQYLPSSAAGGVSVLVVARTVDLAAVDAYLGRRLACRPWFPRFPP